MSKKLDLNVTYHGLVWRVQGYYQREQRAEFYKKNGDPGEPGFPAEIIDAEITLKQDHDESDEMQDILSQKAIDAILDGALEQINDPDYDPDLDDIPW